MTISKDKDRLSTAGGTFQPGWDFKSAYVGGLADDGYERFSQFSASPDTTILYAGPARFTGLSGSTASLAPIGMADNISVQTSPSLARMFEVGSNRSFFTRGKTATALSLGRFLTDQKSLLNVLTQNSYKPIYNVSSQPGATDSNTMMNLDSEYFAVPFGLLAIFKTKGGGTEGYGEGKILSAVYFEYCMLSNYSFQIVSQSPVIQENVGIECDRIVPVALS